MQLDRQTINLPVGAISVRTTPPTSTPSSPSSLPLLFVHGILANGSLWDLVLPRVSAVHHVIVPDLPLGAHAVAAKDSSLLHPEAMADNLAALLDALGVDRVVVVGTDTGGAIAQLFAARHMTRVEALILTSCDAFTHFPPTILKAVKPLAFVPGFAAILRTMYRVPMLRRSWVGAGLAVKRVDHPIIDACFDQGIATPRAYQDMLAFLRGCRPGLTIAAAKALGSFPGRALIAWSRNAPLFPDADGEKLAAAIPRSTLRWIDDSRAFSMIDQPDALADLMLEFLATD